MTPTERIAKAPPSPHGADQMADMQQRIARAREQICAARAAKLNVMWMPLADAERMLDTLAASLRDSERLDWLSQRTHVLAEPHFTPDTGGLLDWDRGEYHHDGARYEGTLREAIDAAAGSGLSDPERHNG